MSDPRHLTTLQASTAYYGDSFTLVNFTLLYLNRILPHFSNSLTNKGKHIFKFIAKQTGQPSGIRLHLSIFWTKSTHTQLQWFTARGTALKEMATLLNEEATSVLWINKTKCLKGCYDAIGRNTKWIHLLSHPVMNFRISSVRKVALRERSICCKAYIYMEMECQIRVYIVTNSAYIEHLQVVK
jgi:hypothetical protein